MDRGGSVFAIRVARVFDGERLLPGAGVVLVADGRIAGVQPAGTPLPGGCGVAAHPAATLLPGLIDTHVHLCADSGERALERLGTVTGEAMTAVIEQALRAHLAAGVTTVRDLGDRHWAALDWRDRHRDDTRWPAVLASGPPITSPRGHCWNMGGEASGVEALRHAVRERAARAADVVKIMASGGVNTPGSDATRPQFTVEELRTVVDEAHAAGLSVTAHAHALTAMEYSLAAGVDGIEHCSFVTGTGVAVREEVVDKLVASGTWVCPTLGQTPGVTPSPQVLEFLRRTGIDLDERARIVGRLHRTGVRLVSGSDAGISPGKAHGILPESVILLVDGGVTPADALASATSLAAQACGIGDRTGRIAEGFDADLLLVDGDPLTDVTALRRVVAVYRGGERC